MLKATTYFPHNLGCLASIKNIYLVIESVSGMMNSMAGRKTQLY